VGSKDSGSARLLRPGLSRPRGRSRLDFGSPLYANRAADLNLIARLSLIYFEHPLLRCGTNLSIEHRGERVPPTPLVISGKRRGHELRVTIETALGIKDSNPLTNGL